jgi:large subunit ribosomal protein L34e
MEKSLPGGKNKVYFKKEKPKGPSCFLCGKPIAGFPRLTPSETNKQNRSRKRVWRPYAGQVCHSCLKNALKQTARTMGKH